ncbi:MAG TPA: RES family NAD+ phosphorylase [Mucilaginibacter sp.]|jgi:RES domain-containing protein|nr:RES family NAD+ phosphorylase [Mucilaginibacter sp.]
MLVFRIAKSEERARDISGYGAFRYGGRWNSKGTRMLYTSMNSSLAYLESLVHFDESFFPPRLFIASIQIPDDETLVYQLPDKGYPKDWQAYGSPENKIIGARWMREAKYLAIKVRSAVNPLEYNFLLNPLFAGYNDWVRIESVEALKTDERLMK